MGSVATSQPMKPKIIANSKEEMQYLWIQPQKLYISSMLPSNMPDAISGPEVELTTMQELSLGHPATGRDIIEDKDFGRILETKSLTQSLNQTTVMEMSSASEYSTIFTLTEENGMTLLAITENQPFANLISNDA